MAEPFSLRVRFGDHKPDEAHSELRCGKAISLAPKSPRVGRAGLREML